MMNIVYIEGVRATVQQFKLKFLTIAFLAFVSLGLTACGGGDSTTVGNSTSSDAPAGNAATVNGKAITLGDVEKAAKRQVGEQWSKLSQLELAQLRLQTLQGLIEQEVMFQKAEKEKTIPTDDEITAEFNKLKTATGRSAEEFQKEMEKAGETEASVREGLKKQLAINKLVEKITGKVDAPKDSEIEAFYKGNPEAFVKKKGVKLAILVVDPAKSGEGDTTYDEASAALKIKDISAKLNQGVDFATVARENSEDQSRANGGDIGYITEDQLKQAYGGQLAGFMNPQVPIGKLIGVPLEGKYYFIKLVERSEKDENQTLETPGVRQQIADALTNGRKELVKQVYAAQSMNEAKIENLLLKKIVDNPNELSGARPAVTPDANANTNANTTSGNTNANTNSNVKTNAASANANAKPAVNAAANAKSGNSNK